MKYNHTQEEEADDIALKVLEFLHYNKNALATAFRRIQTQPTEERSNNMYFDSYTHPALVKRIERAGTPQDLIQLNYEKVVSFAITSSAQMKFDNRRFRQVLPLVEQNIKNGVATADDYVLKANCLLNLNANDEKNNTTIKNILDQAKKLAPNSIVTYRPEIVLALRMNDKTSAIKLLDEYENLLKPNSSLDFAEELHWISNMKAKVKGL